MAEDNGLPQVVVEERPTWRKWLEFVQLIGVLFLGFAFVLPFAAGTALGVWIASTFSIALGCFFAWWSLRLIPRDGPLE